MFVSDVSFALSSRLPPSTLCKSEKVCVERRKENGERREKREEGRKRKKAARLSDAHDYRAAYGQRDRQADECRAREKGRNLCVRALSAATNKITKTKAKTKATSESQERP